MARVQTKSKRKSTGGRYIAGRSKRKFELAGYSAQTKVDDKSKLKTKRTLGGNQKYSLLTAKTISVADKKGKTQKTEIIKALENSANPNLVRRNIITKGAVVETKLGKVRITSRPGQEGTINGVLV
jgi:small subunit ribosomal protein S8e